MQICTAYTVQALIHSVKLYIPEDHQGARKLFVSGVPFPPVDAVQRLSPSWIVSYLYLKNLVVLPSERMEIMSALQCRHFSIIFQES